MTFSSFPSTLQVALQFASTRIRRVHFAVRTSEQSPCSVYGRFRAFIMHVQSPQRKRVSAQLLPLSKVSAFSNWGNGSPAQVAPSSVAAVDASGGMLPPKSPDARYVSRSIASGATRSRTRHNAIRRSRLGPGRPCRKAGATVFEPTGPGRSGPRERGGQVNGSRLRNPRHEDHNVLVQLLPQAGVIVG
jgi:hypothetical protein